MHLLRDYLGNSPSARYDGYEEFLGFWDDTMWFREFCLHVGMVLFGIPTPLMK